MPTASWLPIIGRDFSDVGSQLYNWQQANTSVENANIGRMTAQDQAVANYFSNVANMRRQNQEAQNRMMLSDQTRQEEAAARAERNRMAAYQFGQQMDLEGRRLNQRDEEFKIGNTAAIADAEAARNERLQELAAKTSAAEQKRVAQQLLSLNAGVASYFDKKGTDDIPATALDAIKAGVAAKTGAPVPSYFYFNPSTQQFHIAPQSGHQATMGAKRMADEASMTSYWSPPHPVAAAPAATATATQSPPVTPYIPGLPDYSFGPSALHNPANPTGAPTTPPSATRGGSIFRTPDGRIAQEGDVIRQNGRRYSIINGVPVEL